METPKLQLRKAPEQLPEVGTQEPPATQHFHPGSYCAGPQSQSKCSFCSWGFRLGLNWHPADQEVNSRVNKP